MHLIKMYMYKLLRSVGLWICLILNCILYVLPGLFRLCFPSLFVITGSYSAAGSLLSTVTGCLPCMICAIYSAVFFHDDEKYGFIKNVFPHLTYKTKVYFARMAIALMILFAMYITGFLTAAFFAGLLHGTVGGPGGTIPALLMSFLLSAAFLSLILTLELQTRSTVLPIVLCVISMSGMLSLLISLVSFLLKQILNTESVELEKYVASSLLRKLSIFITSESRSAYFTAAVVSAVYLIITFAWSRLILYRKDIR